MIIGSVRLRDFKSHRDTTVSFGPGINVILGENGAGKTSVLEAISFALFKDYSGNVEGLIRSGAQSMSVEVRFTASGRRYRVVRRRGKSSGDAMLYVEEQGKDKELRSGDSGVDEEIEAIIGIDRYLFSNAVYVRQGEIERLLTETPAKKKQLIGRLLGIESIEKAWASMRDVIEVYRDRKARTEGELMRADELAVQREALKKAVSESRERMAKTDGSIRAAEAALLKARKEESALSEKGRVHSVLAEKAAALRAETKREAAALDSLKRDLSASEDAEKELSEVMKSLPSGWREKAESVVSSLQEKASELGARHGELSGRLSDMTELDGKLEGASGKCPLCGSVLTEAHRKEMIEERKEKEKRTRDELSQVSAGMAEASSAISASRKEMGMLLSLESRRAGLAEKASRRESLSASVQASGKLMKKLSGELSSLESELKGTQEVSARHAEAKKRVDMMVSEVSALREARGRQEGKLAETQAALGRLDDEAKALAGRKELHRKLSSFIATLTEIRSLFDKSGIQLELRKKAVPAIEAHMREFFRGFNFEYSDMRLTDDYDVVLSGPSGESTSGMMSGGERVASALALRLGIAKALAGPGAETVMLDEPTIFLDEQRRMDLVEALRSAGALPQMIVVTHDPAMEDAADSITVLKKEKGASSVSG